MDTVRALKQVILFKDVPDPVLELMAGTAEELSVPAGQTIIALRDTPNALFVIRNGTVRVIPENGKAPPIFFGTGETIGDGLFIDGGPAGGTAVAVGAAAPLVFRGSEGGRGLA